MNKLILLLPYLRELFARFLSTSFSYRNNWGEVCNCDNHKVVKMIYIFYSATHTQHITLQAFVCLNHFSHGQSIFCRQKWTGKSDQLSRDKATHLSMITQREVFVGCHMSVSNSTISTPVQTLI